MGKLKAFSGAILATSHHSKRCIMLDIHILNNSVTHIKKTSRGYRIWIEGAKLTESGFTPNARYDIQYVKMGVIKLTLNPEGKRKVSNSQRNGVDRPIIDIERKSFIKFAYTQDSEVLVRYENQVIYLIAPVEPTEAQRAWVNRVLEENRSSLSSFLIMSER